MLVGTESPATLDPLHAPAMASEHPDAPKQFGIRLSNEVMTLVSAIQEHRKQINKPITLAAVVEDAIRCHYNRLVKESVTWTPENDPGSTSRRQDNQAKQPPIRNTKNN
jgi:hypothetical protein